MDDSRELRDRLEVAQTELKKAERRAAQSQAEFERFRARSLRETADLRERAEAAEAQVAALSAQENPVPARIELPDLRGMAAWRLVALARTPPDPERTVALLTDVEAMTAFDVRYRLRAPPPLPLVLLPQARAESLCAMLSDNALAPVTCDARIQADKERLPVLSFTLDAEALIVNPGQRGEARLAYRDLRLLIHGNRNVPWGSHLEVTPQPHHQPNLETVHETQKVESFLWIHLANGAKAELSDRTDFSGLKETMGVSRRSNLQALALALEQRAPAIVTDDRMTRLARWSLAMLKEGDPHEAMAELLSQAVRLGHLTRS